MNDCEPFLCRVEKALDDAGRVRASDPLMPSPEGLRERLAGAVEDKGGAE